MLNEKELDAAVKSGVITAEQAEALRRQQVDNSYGENETPKVARGFNDVMLALGTAIITVALISQWFGFGIVNWPFVYATFPVLWGISELLNVRRKAVLPGIVAVIGMTIAAGYIGVHFGSSAAVPDMDRTSVRELFSYPARVAMWAALAVAAVNAVYYARFRLPFALLPLAAGLGIAATNALIVQFGWEHTPQAASMLGLFFGGVLFAIAMWYDTSDPLRRTRNADCGFWLHIAAAPLILHSLLSLLGNTPITKGVGSYLVIAIITLLTLVALVIDRRALIVASLGYLLAAISYIVSTASQALGGGTFATLLVLGVVVLVIGMGWHPARRLLLAPFAGQAWVGKLPPLKV